MVTTKSPYVINIHFIYCLVTSKADSAKINSLVQVINKYVFFTRLPLIGLSKIYFLCCFIFSLKLSFFFIIFICSMLCKEFVHLDNRVPFLVHACIVKSTVPIPFLVVGYESCYVPLSDVLLNFFNSLHSNLVVYG